MATAVVVKFDRFPEKRVRFRLVCPLRLRALFAPQAGAWLMKIHLLDMGTRMYGDCVLVTHGGKTILIDGGHPPDADSIRDQLKELLGKSPPFNIDLLVVTHCHSDHIGCLPTLIEDDVLTVKQA